MSISAALEEAYASGNEAAVVLTAVELDHPGFDAPIYLVAGIDAPGGSEGDMVSLPIVAGGDPVPHYPCSFTLTRPGMEKDGPTDGKISVDGVSGLLNAPLKAALGYGEKISINFRQYLVYPGAGLPTGPDEVITGLQLRLVSLSPTTAEGTLSWPDGRNFNVPTGPDAFFDRDSYPTLFTT